METNLGIISVVPPLVAILLAFITRNAIFSLALACLLGVLLTGSGPQGFTKLMINALANSSFTWVFLLEIFIGILIAFFLKTGAIKGFTIFVERQNLSRAGIQLSAWAMGIFVCYRSYHRMGDLYNRNYNWNGTNFGFHCSYWVFYKIDSI